MCFFWGFGMVLGLGLYSGVQLKGTTLKGLGRGMGRVYLEVHGNQYRLMTGVRACNPPYH